MATAQYIGSRVTLISRQQQRYEGILHDIDVANKRVTLSGVRHFGSEDRVTPSGTAVPASSEVYDFISFNSSDLLALQIQESPKTAAESTANPAPQAQAQPQQPPQSQSQPSAQSRVATQERPSDIPAAAGSANQSAPSMSAQPQGMAGMGMNPANMQGGFPQYQGFNPYGGMPYHMGFGAHTPEMMQAHYYQMYLNYLRQGAPGMGPGFNAPSGDAPQAQIPGQPQPPASAPTPIAGPTATQPAVQSQFPTAIQSQAPAQPFKPVQATDDTTGLESGFSGISLAPPTQPTQLVAKAPQTQPQISSGFSEPVQHIIKESHSQSAGVGANRSGDYSSGPRQGVESQYSRDSNGENRQDNRRSDGFQRQDNQSFRYGGQQRGGYNRRYNHSHGGNRSGREQTPQERVPLDDFDFVTSTATFDKESFIETVKAEKQQITEPSTSESAVNYQKSSFFDNLSAPLRSEEPRNRYEQRRLDTETFGTANTGRGGYRGGYRGGRGGYRGGRGGQQGYGNFNGENMNRSQNQQQGSGNFRGGNRNFGYNPTSQNS
eukprot:TRINITY_DN553_c0_g1_i1.p1 TRINITY_DN553_c0_g1~~TRINITY_DN553_c0_g1_i1.p1  ORF type:complete len:547 (-),score=115.62 TRINITY_DN553_c0_g1_i1:220-1860(-)